MSKYNVVFEGESFSTDDDKNVSFDELKEKFELPEDFMPKMFEYLESDYNYKILYQIKHISMNGSSADPKTFVAVMTQYNNGEKGGILLDEINDVLQVVGSMKIKDVQSFVNDVYTKPDSFELVVVTVDEKMAP
jgi:hypothetical protein